MGWSFRKRIKVLPGVHINIGKNGVSTSIGGKGGSVNFSKRGTRVTNSIPGTGLSHSKLYGNANRTTAPSAPRTTGRIGAAIGAVLVFMIVSSITNFAFMLALNVLTGPDVGSGIGYLVGSITSLYLGFKAARWHYRRERTPPQE